MGMKAMEGERKKGSGWSYKQGYVPMRRPSCTRRFHSVLRNYCKSSEQSRLVQEGPLLATDEDSSGGCGPQPCASRLGWRFLGKPGQLVPGENLAGFGPRQP